MKVKGMKQAGFSLVELMVVVGIIGILAALAVPKLQIFMAKAKVSEGKGVVNNMSTLQQAYYAENSAYLAVVQGNAANYTAIGYTPRVTGVATVGNNVYFNDPQVIIGGAIGAAAGQGFVVSSWPRREVCRGVTTAAGSAAQVNQDQNGTIYYGAALAVNAAPTVASQNLAIQCR